VLHVLSRVPKLVLQLSVYGESAWTFHAGRQEFYYHTFSEDEPDLNLTNTNVVADLDVRFSVLYFTINTSQVVL